MPTINLAYVAELALRYLRKFIYASQTWIFLIFIGAMLTSFVTSFVVLYNLINTTINFLSSPDISGEILSKMFGLMHCMGITDAFNDNKSILLSSILFLLYRILYRQFISAYFKVMSLAKPLVN